MLNIVNNSNLFLDRNRSFPSWFVTTLLFACACLVLIDATNAQDAAAKPKASSSLQDSSLDDVLTQYNQASEKLRSSLKKVQAASIRFHNESSDHSETNREAWQEAVESGEAQIERLRVAAMELFRRQEKPSDDVLEMAVRSCLEDVREERYRVGLEVLKRANTINPTVGSRSLMARVQLLDNEFEPAKSFFVEHPEERQSMNDTERNLYAAIDQLISQFRREKQLRETEARDDDLPRVELTTSAGPIVVELFENEAPETVANFVYLVEQGFYNGVIFHNVKTEFVAQAGAFGVAQVDGGQRVLPRGVRYTIYDEHKKPEARKHFRGSLSMANQNKADTASSNFFLSLAPQPRLNENHTVFGRVIEGLPAMADLTVNVREDEKGQEEQIEGTIPSMIFSAKVIRKRDHDYQPVKFGSKTKTAIGSADKQKSQAE